ncbi:MAG: type I methionyl aminopeptidase [Oscillospiraceae bacterium]|nr:type I methionyl aminopeptidase [Oscillospiraceae bacterium]MBQ4547209.1 type I methionyl aminopeptidase [Oscillospiraceae bacterium]
MVILKPASAIKKMREAGRLSALALKVGGEAVRPGVTTAEIDKAIYDFIMSQGATPSFLNLYGFPASACISVNDELIHGIPGNRVIKEGDIVSIDVGACLDGYHGDNAATFVAGTASEEAQQLLDVTKQSLYKGIEMAVVGNRIGDISNAVQTYCEERGYSVVREFVGHGIGRSVHEDPEVPNFGAAGHGPRLVNGMCIAIEPMINAGTRFVSTDSNGWTVRTKDGKLSAHFEHTIAITDNGPIILTDPD